MSDQQAQHPAFSNPPATSADDAVKVTAAEYSELQRLRDLPGQLDALKAQHQAELEALRAANAEAIAARDQATQAHAQADQAWQAKLAEVNQAAESLRQRSREQVKAHALAEATAGIQWAGENAEVRARVAAKFRRDLADSFDIHDAGDGRLELRERVTGRPLSEAIKDALRAPENQGFFAPITRGGSGTDGRMSQHSPEMGWAAAGHQPGSLDWYSGRFQGQQAARQAATGIVLRSG